MDGEVEGFGTLAQRHGDNAVEYEPSDAGILAIPRVVKRDN